MVRWARNLGYVHQEFTNLLFDHCGIGCESTFYWMPQLGKWVGEFKTRFKYLSLAEMHNLNIGFLDTYYDFVAAILEVREKFAREYNYYFNAVWC